MAKIIPNKSFYRLDKDKQVTEAVKRMNECYADAEQWKQLAQQARKKHIIEPDERPDLELLKNG